MRTNQHRWEKMDKSSMLLARLYQHYLTTCRTEGKTPATIRGYREKLGRFIRWCDGAALPDFSIEMAREYIGYLQSAPKYESHPFHSSHGESMSPANIRNHVQVLKGFSSWLYREQYTDENILHRLKVPKAPAKVMETLSEPEIQTLFASLDQNAQAGCRDAAILLLFLDTGLRCSELLHLTREDVHFEDQWLKVMGKGQKERMAPFGNQAAKLLQRYFFHFRPHPLREDRFFLCLDGSPMTEASIKMVFARLKERAGVPRLHMHLLRHIFATRYLMGGGDPLSLQRILGHTTLEMTRRYVDVVAMEQAIQQRRPSPMDTVKLGIKGRANRGGGRKRKR